MIEEQEALDLAADWADISRGLRKDLGNQLYSQWIKPIQLGALCKQSGQLDLYLPNEFAANWVADRFADRLSLAWKIARPDIRSVQISVLPGRRPMPGLRLGREDGRRAAPPLQVIQRTGTDNLPVAALGGAAASGLSTGSYEGLQVPSVWRNNRSQAAAKVDALASNGMDEIEIPAFLRKQAD